MNPGLMSTDREVVFGTLNGCPVRCSRRLAAQLGVVVVDDTTGPETDEHLSEEDEQDTVESAKPTAADVRAWALDNGVDCPAKGRIPASVVEAYHAAH